MAYVHRVRRGTTAAYAALNRIYAEGEILAELGVDGNYRLKVGDGATAYNSLPYVLSGEGAGPVPAFGTVAVPSQSSLVADTQGDTLTFVATGGISALTSAGSDQLTIAPIYGTGPNTVCQGNDSRLGSSAAHATTHKSGGSDFIRLDELAAPTDVTTLNASTGAHGLAPKLSGVSSQYLSGIGAWTIPGITGIKTVKDYGALGDSGGSSGAPGTDDLSAFNAATTDCLANGYALFIPPGVYRLTSRWTIPGRVFVFGVGAEPYKHNLDGTRGNGSWLYFDHTDIGIKIVWTTNEENDISGLVLKDFGTIRNQPAPAASWTPTANDYDIVTERADVAFYNLMLWNATKGINIIQPGYGLGRLTIDGVRGQCFQVGICVTATYDVARISNVHFWPFWNVSDYLKIYMQANFKALLLYRADGIIVHNFFAIWYGIGLEISPSAFGDLNRAQFTNFILDLGNIGILLEIGTGASPSLPPSLQFSNTVIYSDPGINGVSMLIRGDNARIDMMNTELRQNKYNAIQVQGTNNTLTLTNTRIGGWNIGGAGSYAISLGSGNWLNFGSLPIFFESNGGPILQATGAAVTNYFDTQFYLSVAFGNPLVVCDANDYMAYDRTNNRFEFYIGGTRRAYIDTAGFHNG